MHQRLKEGEQVVAKMKSLFKALPSNGRKVQDLWYEAMDLATHITSGVVCLRTHLEVEMVISEDEQSRLNARTDIVANI
jgi:hypothetical protein